QLGGGLSANYPSPSSRNIAAVMRANARRDTKPELALRSLLHSQGYRYRVHHKVLISGQHHVRPDIVFAKNKVAVFIDGCFWHSCPKHGTKPRQNADYWRAKLRRNRMRDRRNTTALTRAGWLVIRGWEHEKPARIALQVHRVMQRRKRTSESDHARRR